MKPDVPPPRYEQVGGWKHLICDEQEWLARPASWGIEYLPEGMQARKRCLYKHHYYGWLAGFIGCPVCRPLVRELFSEEGFHTPSALVVEGDWRDWRNQRDQLQERYAALHPAGNCDAEQVIRCVGHYGCGVLTEVELFNRVVDELYSRVDHLGRQEQTPRYRLARTERERELALELIGPNPFRPVTFAPEWHTDTAVSLARTMYDSREFSAMPILADALQDAGCDNEQILAHCRDANQVHVRGCWVVDLVSGKE
jgi:hypothetical protein